jgi:invasion protein IalB
VSSRRLAVLVAAVGVAIGLSGFTAWAQTKKKDAAPPAKAAPAAPAAAAAPQSAWVKLCEKGQIASKDAAGKDVKEEKSICLTHHERLDGNSGMVLVSAAIRQVEGNESEHLMIMVPLGMAIPPGLRAAVYNNEQWAHAQKNEKIDDSQIKAIQLRFTLCHPAGCTAEIEATPELIEEMKTGGGLMVLSVNAAGQIIAFPIPLVGFKSAMEGPPVDNQKYGEARKALFETIRQRQLAALEEQKKAAADAAKKGGTPPPPAATPPPKK